MTEQIVLKKANTKDAEKIGEVFDLYRQFYKKESDVEICKKYIKERLDNNAVSYTHLTLPTTR